MNHQHILNEWARLKGMIDAARPSTDNPQAHACLDALQRLAEEHSKIVAEKQAEAAASDSKPK